MSQARGRPLILKSSDVRDADMNFMLFLPARNPGAERSEGPMLAPGDEARTLTGIETVVDRAEFDAAMKAIASEARHVYVPFRAESVGAVATDGTRGSRTAAMAFPLG